MSVFCLHGLQCFHGNYVNEFAYPARVAGYHQIDKTLIQHRSISFYCQKIWEKLASAPFWVEQDGLIYCTAQERCSALSKLWPLHWWQSWGETGPGIAWPTASLPMADHGQATARARSGKKWKQIKKHKNKSIQRRHIEINQQNIQDSCWRGTLLQFYGLRIKLLSCPLVLTVPQNYYDHEEKGWILYLFKYTKLTALSVLSHVGFNRSLLQDTIRALCLEGLTTNTRISIGKPCLK
jgi:hypothetical protein